MQELRESGILTTIYFDDSLIPESPEEPDPEYVEFVEPKTIPLDKPENLTYERKELKNLSSGGPEVIPFEKQVSTNR